MDSGPGTSEHDELEVLHLALSDLRRKIRSRSSTRPETRVDNESLREFDWQAAFNELRHRFGSLGMVERSGEVDEFGMDEVTLRRASTLLALLYERYWRVELSGVERLPDGTFVTTTYGHWVKGESPFIVSVRFKLEELDEKARAAKK